MITALPTFPERVGSAVVGFFARPLPPVRVMRPEPVEEHPVIRALRKAGKPLTNQQLARCLGVSEGQSTKLRRKVKARLIEWRQGKYVFVTIADFHDLPTGSGRKLNGNWRKS